MTKEELIEYVGCQYEIAPDHPFLKYPDMICFRHENNRKWFAIVMEVQKRKLGIPEDGCLDIVNVKADPILIGSLREERGFFPAYHMSKTGWLSAALDGSAPDDTIKMLLEMSYRLTSVKIKK